MPILRHRRNGRQLSRFPPRSTRKRSQKRANLSVDSSWLVGGWSIQHSVHHWINDGLMTIFIFVVGMEIKREVLVGELSSLKSASLPVIAAIGGIIVSAVFYWLVNQGGEGARGWAPPWRPTLPLRWVLLRC